MKWRIQPVKSWLSPMMHLILQVIEKKGYETRNSTSQVMAITPTHDPHLTQTETKAHHKALDPAAVLLLQEVEPAFAGDDGADADLLHLRHVHGRLLSVPVLLLQMGVPTLCTRAQILRRNKTFVLLWRKCSMEMNTILQISK